MIKMKLPILFVLFTILNTGYGYSALFNAEEMDNYINRPAPTPPEDHAKVARTLVHKAYWGAAGTLSSLPELEGYPMVNIISIADSAKDAPSTGNIYFLLTDLDFTGQDIKKNNKITFMISDDEDLSCTNYETDPMEPTCARVMLTGSVIELEEETSEFNFANDSFISRHPAALRWQKAHHFYLCKLNITNIFVLDWYGGPHNVSIEDYYKVSPEEARTIRNEIPIDKPIRPERELHIKIHKDKYKVIRIDI